MFGIGYLGSVYYGGWITTTGVVGPPATLVILITFDPLVVVDVGAAVTLEDSASTAELTVSMT